MQLSRSNIKNIQPIAGLTIPADELFSLPEKILQFGTGVLLRGLPDYFVDKANRQGLFNGRIVVVKSTSQGSADAFTEQDGLFTLCIRGVENGEPVREAIIQSSISRVLSATIEWDAIIACASNPDMQIIISNTTEVGISLTDDYITARPPKSFPGKLLAFLLARYNTFNGSAESGMVIVPTELITDNGSTLRSIVLQLAVQNKLDNKFIAWLKEHNHFCNSLVDRIVPGKLSTDEYASTSKELGYDDELLILAEPFRLWAIESDSKEVQEKLSFALADEGVVIAPSIEKFRELKLRLLNGTHSFSSGIATLAGFPTVRSAMENPLFVNYIQTLMGEEIGPAITGELISEQEARSFSSKVIDRFSNPSLEHKWSSITVQYSSKMKMRNVPLLLKYYERFGSVPESMALGFAAFILFMKSKDKQIDDTHYSVFNTIWRETGEESVVKQVLSKTDFWGTDLAALPGFAERVSNYLQSLVNEGALKTLERFEKTKVTA